MENNQKAIAWQTILQDKGVNQTSKEAINTIKRMKFVESIPTLSNKIKHEYREQTEDLLLMIITPDYVLSHTDFHSKDLLN